ncbi:MAG TPA: FtsX-like permease family protein [Planctomycetota bacterium]|nr:FtsX-like permease family protein [Planctomycetota bacterium]
MAWRSATASRLRFAIAAAGVFIPAALVTATANFALDVESKMTRELRSSGPNVILEVRRGTREMDPAELARALRLLPGVLGTAMSRPDRVELSVSGSYPQIEAALAAIGEGSRTLQARTIPVIAAREGRVLAKMRGLLALMGALILAAGGLAMALGLAAGVAERRPEIGLLRALGATGGRVVRFFAVQAGLVLALGMVAGVLAGTVLSDLMCRSVFGIGAELRPAAVAVAVGACVAVTLGASIVPLRRALRIDPALVLRGE